MRATRLRTLRGSVFAKDGVIKKQLILDDGRINHGLKILSFVMWSSTGGNEAGIDATLALALLPAGQAQMDASNNAQIGWVTGGFDNAMNTAPLMAILDPDHVINRDLYLYAFSTEILWNYLIIAQEYDLSDDEAIVQIIKETSQTTLY
jgi:hypothetical protein